MYKNVCSIKLVYLLVGLMLLGGTIGCGTWDRKYYNFEPSPYDRAVLRSMGKNPNVPHNMEPMIINGMKVEFKDEYLHIKDLNITIPYNDIQISDADALGFARDVQKALRKRMNTARRVRLASSSIQILTAAAAGSLGIIAHSDVETISALGAVSAIIPELQSIFKAKGRSKAYGDGHDLIRKAVARYHQRRNAASGNGKIPTDKLTTEGSQLMGEVAASIKAVDTALQQSIPSIEDMKAATGQLEEKFAMKVFPEMVKMPPPVTVGAKKLNAAFIRVINDRAIIALSDNTNVVDINQSDATSFKSNETLDVINLDSVGTGTATIKILGVRDDVAVVKVKVGNRPPVAKAGGNQTISLQNSKTVTLNGKGSFDLDGDKLRFSWALNQSGVRGLTTVLSNLNSDITTFDAFGTGTYQVDLTVSDGIEVGTDTATISVIP